MIQPVTTYKVERLTRMSLYKTTTTLPSPNHVYHDANDRTSQNWGIYKKGSRSCSRISDMQRWLANYLQGHHTYVDFPRCQIEIQKREGSASRRGPLPTAFHLFLCDTPLPHLRLSFSRTQTITGSNTNSTQESERN